MRSIGSVPADWIEDEVELRDDLVVGAPARVIAVADRMGGPRVEAFDVGAVTDLEDAVAHGRAIRIGIDLDALLDDADVLDLVVGVLADRYGIDVEQLRA